MPMDETHTSPEYLPLAEGTLEGLTLEGSEFSYDINLLSSLLPLFLLFFQLLLL